VSPYGRAPRPANELRETKAVKWTCRDDGSSQPDAVVSWSVWRKFPHCGRRGAATLSESGSDLWLRVEAIAPGFKVLGRPHRAPDIAVWSATHRPSAVKCILVRQDDTWGVGGAEHYAPRTTSRGPFRRTWMGSHVARNEGPRPRQWNGAGRQSLDVIRIGQKVAMSHSQIR
jgi:hypothetical protein